MKKHDQIVFLAKTKLNKIGFFISKTVVGSCIGHHEFVSVNDALNEYDEMKEEIKKNKELISVSEILI